MYKLIALDLDGTLLNSEKTIDKETVDALMEAAEKGIEIVPCTGRFYLSMPEVVRKLPFLNYCITINGSAIYDIKKDRYVRNVTMNKETALEIVDLFYKYPIAFDVYIDNWGYIDRRFHQTIENYLENIHYINVTRECNTPVEDIRAKIKSSNGVQKIQMFCKDDILLGRVFSEAKDRFSDICDIATSGTIDMEITDKEAIKGNGLHNLCDYLGIDIKDTISFGDGSNDISLLAEAGLGIAMANAKKMLLPYADDITLSNNENGVAYALKKYVL